MLRWLDKKNVMMCEIVGNSDFNVHSSTELWLCSYTCPGMYPRDNEAWAPVAETLRPSQPKIFTHRPWQEKFADTYWKPQTLLLLLPNPGSGLEFCFDLEAFRDIWYFLWDLERKLFFLFTIKQPYGYIYGSQQGALPKVCYICACIIWGV